MTPKELWGSDRCGVCEEPLKLTDDDVAEMVLQATHEHKIVHYMCGHARGMELA